MKRLTQTKRSRIHEADDRPLVVGTYLSRLVNEAQLKMEESHDPDEVKYSQWQMRLADVLQSYSDVPLSEFKQILRRRGKRSSSNIAALPFDQHSECSGRPVGRVEAPTGKRRSPKATLPSDLESLDQGGIEGILDNKDYTKSQLAELGSRRFGISQSSLMRTRKDEAIMVIRTALMNERTLDIIAKVAGNAANERVN